MASTPTNNYHMEMSHVDLHGINSNKYDLYNMTTTNQNKVSDLCVRMNRYSAFVSLFLIVLLGVGFTIEYLHIKKEVQALHKNNEVLHQKISKLEAEFEAQTGRQPVMTTHEEQELFEKEVRNDIDFLNETLTAEMEILNNWQKKNNTELKMKIESLQSTVDQIQNSFNTIEQVPAIYDLSENLHSLSQTVVSMDRNFSLLIDIGSSQMLKIQEIQWKTGNISETKFSDIDALFKSTWQLIQAYYDNLTNQRKDLNQTLTVSDILNTSIKDLKQQTFSKLTNITDELEYQSTRYQSKIATLEGAIEELNRIVQDLFVRNKELTDKIFDEVESFNETDSLARELAVIDNHTSITNEDTKQIRKDIHALEAHIANIIRDVSKLENLHTLQTEIDLLTGKVEEQANRLGTLEENISTMSNELNLQNLKQQHANKKLEDFSESISMQSNRVDKITSVVQKLTERKKNRVSSIGS